MLKNAESENERCLLKFISCPNCENGLLDVISDFGIVPVFKDTNDVYQIIDELYYSKYLNKAGV